MNSTTKQIDEILHWEGFWDCNSHCRLRIFRPLEQPDLAVVIVSELQSNQGTSITNSAEKLIKLICDRYSLDPGQTMWVEHYPSDCMVKEDTYSQVLLAGSKVNWKPLTRAKVEKLVGYTLD